MTIFNYALDKYSWESALFWGNFKEHCEKASDSKATLGDRCIHILIAAAEFLPIIGQIASIFEKIIVENFSVVTPITPVDIEPNKNDLEQKQTASTTDLTKKNVTILNTSGQNVISTFETPQQNPENEPPLTPEIIQPEFHTHAEAPNSSRGANISIASDPIQTQNLNVDPKKSEIVQREGDINDPVLTQEQNEQLTKTVTKMQSLCRMYLAWQKQEQIKASNKTSSEAITKIQRFCRMHLAIQQKEQLKATNDAATKIQRFCRMHLAIKEKEQLKATNEAATKIQKFCRMHLAIQEKEQLKTTGDAATKIQKFCRMHLAIQEKEQLKTTGDATTKIQKFCRTHLATQKKEQIQIEVRAATTIQRFCRTYSALQKKEKIIKATTEIQRFYRMHLARRTAEALTLPSLQIDPQSSLNTKLNDDMFGDYVPYMPLSSFIEKSDKYFEKMTCNISPKNMELLNKRIEELDQKINLKRRLNALDQFSKSFIYVRDVFPSWGEAYDLKFSLLMDGEIRNLKVADVEKVEPKFISKRIGIKLREFVGNDSTKVPITDAQLTPESIKNLKLIDFSRLTSEQIKKHIKEIPPIAYYVISILKLPANVIENLSSEQFEIFSDELRRFDKKQTLSFIQSLLNTNSINKPLLNKLLPEFSSSLKEVVGDLNEQEVFKLYPFFSSHHWRYLSKPQALALLRELLKMDKIDAELLKNLMPEYVFHSQISFDDLTNEEIIKIYPFCPGYNKYLFDQKTFDILCNLLKSDYSEADLDRESEKLFWIYLQKERLYTLLAENYFKLGCLDKALEAIKHLPTPYSYDLTNPKETFILKIAEAHLKNRNREKACSIAEKIINTKLQEEFFAQVADAYCSENDLDGLKNLYKYGTDIKDICILKAAQTHFKNGFREKACEVIDTISSWSRSSETKMKFFQQVADSYCDEGKLDELKKLHKYGTDIKDICTVSIANSYLKKGDRKQAYATVKNVSDNIKEEFLVRLADSHYNQGELAEALQIVQRLAYYCSAKEPFIIKIASAHLNNGERKTAYAIIKTISNNKAKDKFLKQLAESYYSAGMLEKAHKTIQKGYLSFETRREFILKIAKAYLEKGDKKKAIEVLDKSSFHTKEIFEFLIQIAQMYFSENNEAMVLKIIEKIAQDSLMKTLAAILESKIYIEMMWDVFLKKDFFVRLAQNCFAQTKEYFSNKNAEAILQEIVRKASDDATIQAFFNFKSSTSSQANDQDKFDPYKKLGLASTASKEEVRIAFKKLSLKYHPDKAKQTAESGENEIDFKKRMADNEEEFKSIRRAYDMIMEIFSQKSNNPTQQSKPSPHQSNPPIQPILRIL